ncbi:acetoacetyl-CoA synthetase-like protein [Mytilinidion resinicola]|uniref:Acetoacetyl-CoA synthetase-like protein n=1 Tax=Mytilinidion resinicola TaxID=574789 RepID=A0A6A6Y772_9PEZI|nr:acetoacetyl-CoA synthetase-like protein [Mytilinidion resinicola]KAF2804540.1 acetoacetyl-CoA synthetase-like protein [Mytilinidion resinicola]
MDTPPRSLWKHADPESTYMWDFMQKINANFDLDITTFRQLYDFSVSRRNDFWSAAFEYLLFIHEGSYQKPVDENASITSLPIWFDGIRLNFAENILYTQKPGVKDQRSTLHKEDGKIAFTEIREGGSEKRDVTWGSLREGVARVARAMKASGVQKGDRIAVIASNSGDTLKVFLGCTALGAVFSSSSSDMGAKGLLERLVQIKPKFVFMDDGALYNGQKIDLRPKMNAVIEGMKDIHEFEGIISQPRFSTPHDISGIPRVMTTESWLQRSASDKEELTFERVAFHDPLFIVYSSGTTGTPKCIVHTVGGSIISNAKEALLHRSMDYRSISLTYTTTGWIMYAALIFHLLKGSKIILYDGSPFLPSVTSLLEIAAQERVTHFGTSPRYLLELQRKRLKPRELFDLSALEVVVSTGSVLSDAQFEWFYDEGFPESVQLSNLSGGTDICGSFACGNPLEPVHTGGCQGPVLGTPISIFDPTIEGDNVKGTPVSDGMPGELVATASFPNVPLGFWADPGGKRFLSSYFERFAESWTHGDLVQQHPVTKQIFFLGRSDGVLNPQGVRFGSAEIYSVLEGTFPQIQDSICVGQRRPIDADERVVLFVMMRHGQTLSQKLIRDIKSEIGKQLSKRHVPAYVFATPNIPVTVNGKKVELPVKRIVSGQVVTPAATIANPQCLQYYYQFVDVENPKHSGSKL